MLLPQGIALPIPLDYEEKKNKYKVDPTKLLALVQDHCEAYLKAEVLPYRPMPGSTTARSSWAMKFLSTGTSTSTRNREHLRRSKATSSVWNRRLWGC